MTNMDSVLSSSLFLGFGFDWDSLLGFLLWFDSSRDTIFDVLVFVSQALMLNFLLLSFNMTVLINFES